MGLAGFRRFLALLCDLSFQGLVNTALALVNQLVRVFCLSSVAGALNESLLYCAAIRFSPFFVANEPRPRLSCKEPRPYNEQARHTLSLVPAPFLGVHVLFENKDLSKAMAYVNISRDPPDIEVS